MFAGLNVDKGLSNHAVTVGLYVDLLEFAIGKLSQPGALHYSIPPLK